MNYISVQKLHSLKEGDRVVLPANENEGWKEERGIIHDASAATVVEILLDKECLDGDNDDGIRVADYRQVVKEEKYDV